MQNFKPLPPELKAELEAKKQLADISARIRNANIERPLPPEPKREVKVIPERPMNPYRTETTVSSWYWEFEEQGIQQSAAPVYKSRNPKN